MRYMICSISMNNLIKCQLSQAFFYTMYSYRYGNVKSFLGQLPVYNEVCVCVCVCVPSFRPSRNGEVHEERGWHGRGADGGGEEPAVGGLQERDRCPSSLLEDHQQPGTEGGEQGGRGHHQDDPGIQAIGKRRRSMLTICFKWWQ